MAGGPQDGGARRLGPGGDVDVKRYYDFVKTPNGSERLILTPAPADQGQTAPRHAPNTS